MSLRRLQVKGGILILVAVTLAVSFVVLVLVHAHVISATIDRYTYDLVVESLQDQVDLLKWIGTGIIGSLCAVIALLWRTTQRQQKIIVEEVRSQATVREEILSSASDTRGVMDRLTDAVVALEKKISECPVTKEWEEARAEAAKSHKRT